MELTGKALGASDGEIGQVKDFYFDDEHWAVRYVIAETGSWLSGRLVLISPHAFGTLHQEGDHLLVKLTRQQMEDSPAIDLHRPVSRQDEEEYNRYYRWPSYWIGGEMWGVGAFPSPYLVPVMEASSVRRNPNEDDPQRSNDDPHVRSTKALSGYHIQTDEGTVGHVADFLMVDQGLAICHLVVETGHWFSGKQILISPNQIDRVSCQESKVFVRVTKEAILQAAEYQGPPLIAT